MAEVETKKSSNSWLKWGIIGCIVLFICFVACVIMSFVLLSITVGVGLKVARDEITDKICLTTSTDIRRSYNNETTTDFRNHVTYYEFESMVKEISGEVCNNLEEAQLWDLLKSGWSISYSNEDEERLSLKAKINEKVVDLEMREEGDDLKIDSLDVR